MKPAEVQVNSSGFVSERFEGFQISKSMNLYWHNE